MADTVRLRLPAGTAYGRVARVTTAAIARRHEFTYREVEDLRLAIDEAIIALLDDRDPHAAVELRYRVDEDSVSITVEGAPDRPPEAVARFHTLVTALVDRADLDLQAGRVVLMKRHQARP
jgi:anti-sigma regulatory factor (Ser/Thr protein kinase)